MSFRVSLTAGLQPLRSLKRTTPTIYNIHHAPSRHHSHSSVDPTEISHFNALASSWWDPHGPSRLLHLMNPLRHAFLSRCLSLSGAPAPARPPHTTTSSMRPRSLHLLDIGCGGGIFAE